MVTFAPDEIGLADKSPCANIRADLKMCLLESDCCRKEKKTPRECLNQGLCPDECLQLRQTFFECKRSLGDCRLTPDPPGRTPVGWRHHTVMRYLSRKR